ncbi:DUF1310 family protein [Streptococcus caprae]|uniref:DUF1310 family protein n=1 Tax=Streptococcus caprae TaxID=1640501 RepID=A0ABV8CVN5_9STRE
MTKQKFLNLSILSLLVLALLGGCSILGGKKATEDKREAEKQEMIEIVESEEVQEQIRHSFKNLDKQSFTEQGTIKSYELDKDSVYLSPSHSIHFTLFINGDKGVTISENIALVNGEYELGGSSISEELSDLLSND